MVSSRTIGSLALIVLAGCTPAGDSTPAGDRTPASDTDPLSATCEDAIECDRLVLGSQDELADAPLCRSINGDFRLQYNGGDLTRIHDIGDTFRCLTHVTDEVTITSTNLTDLDGLSTLESVDLQLDVWGNALMTSVELESLEFVGAGLQIMGNDALTHASFPVLTTVNDTETEGLGEALLEVEMNEQLTSLDFPALTEVWVLSVEQNDAITDLSGLQSIETAFRLTITSNPSLCTSVVDEFLEGVSTSDVEYNYGNNGC